MIETKLVPNKERVLARVLAEDNWRVTEGSGLPLLDAFCEFLLQARPDFDWAGSRVAVRFESIAELATKRSERLTQLHVAALDR